MSVFGAVFRYVFGTLLLPTLFPTIRRMQRDIWRIDQKLNRHLKDNSTEKPAPDDLDALKTAYPYLKDFPWTEANGPERDPPMVGGDSAVGQGSR